jgi:hypothetical protein
MTDDLDAQGMSESAILDWWYDEVLFNVPEECKGEVFDKYFYE